MGCDDEKLSKYLTHTFMAHCHTMICQQVTLSGEAEWPKVADAVIEAGNQLCEIGHGPPPSCRKRGEPQRVVWRRHLPLKVESIAPKAIHMRREVWTQAGQDLRL